MNHLGGKNTKMFKAIYLPAWELRTLGVLYRVFGIFHIFYIEQPFVIERQ